MQRFDLVVIGSGPAGEKAAAQAAYFGKRVAIVERAPVPGGSAVTNAGIPTKTLRETALYVSGFRRREVYGVSLELPPDAIVATMRARAREVVDSTVRSVQRNIERHGIELIRGRAVLADDCQVLVSTPHGERMLSAEVVLIATGSRPFHGPGIPFDDADVLDSETILQLNQPFRSLTVLGAGPVGCEYASIFNALGVDVTLVDRSDRLLPFLDAEVSQAFLTIIQEMGVRVILGRGRASVERDGERLRVGLPDGEVISPDKVLFAAGRVGNTDGIGLGRAGVQLDGRKRIVVNDKFQTSAPNIYAAGDVLGPPALASVSMEQGRVAACFAFDIPFHQSVDGLAPFGVYSVPEVGMVGLSEEQASANGIDYETGRSWFADNRRATISGASEGLLKLVFQREDRRLLGVHVVGDLAAELVHQGQAVLHHSGTIDYFIHATFNVPTLAEAYKYAAYDGLQRLAGSRFFHNGTGGNES